MILSVAQLEKALQIRTKIDKLEAIINRLHKQLQDILGSETVKPKAVRRKRRKVKVQVPQKVKAQGKVKLVKLVKRVKNEGGGLKESLVKVLTQAGKPLHIDEILKDLKAVGHKTVAKDIKKQVGVRLYTGKEFLKTAPGIFTLKAMRAKASKEKVKK